MCRYMKSFLQNDRGKKERSLCGGDPTTRKKESRIKIRKEGREDSEDGEKVQ